MNSAELRRLRKENKANEDLHRLGWYHSFRFADGTEYEGVLAVEVSEYRYSKFPIPDDLAGKRVLDIGAWDGWFSFEAERHGADVTAVDMVEVPNFWKVHRKLRSHVTYRECDLFEIPQAGLGKFDYVFFLGVLYHTKYPLLALEIVCGLTQDIAIVESYVTDAATWESHRDDLPALEFYEAEELGGQLDNWFGPTVGCLIAMSRAAGFARVEVLHVENNRAALACYRRWLPDDADAAEFPGKFRDVRNTLRDGINFRATREEYLTWWFDYEGDTLTRDDIRLQVDDLGLPTMYTIRRHGTLWLANSRLPVNLDAGWHILRMSIRGSRWSEPRRIAVDLQPSAESLAITVLCDGTTWVRNEVDSSGAATAHISLWVTGLGDNCDVANTRVMLNGARLKVTYIGEPDGDYARQVNADLAQDVAEGKYRVWVQFGGVQSPPADLTVRATGR
jgi:tRNA (mo5U34)-methyltransferase